MLARCLVIVGLLTAALPRFAGAEEAVKIGSDYALLNKAGSARVGLILIPGGSGNLNVQPDGTFKSGEQNQLVRTRKDYLASGITTLTIDNGVDVAEAVNYLRKLTPVVVVAGTSRGTLRVPKALPAKPDAIVLTSGLLNDVRGMVGSPSNLPSTLIVHHRQDGCRVTLPSGVEPFKTWGGAKVKVVWLDGGTFGADLCGNQSHHGFLGQDAQVVSTVAQFVKSVR